MDHPIPFAMKAQGHLEIKYANIPKEIVETLMMGYMPSMVIVLDNLALERAEMASDDIGEVVFKMDFMAKDIEVLKK